MHDFILPPPLEPGDTVATIAPSAGCAAAFPEVYRLGVERLESLLDVKAEEYPTVSMSGEALYAHPEKRARDLEHAFRDPEIGAIVATIGGNDQIRVLRHFDPSVAVEHPTRFFGISDNTVLHAALWQQGVVSFYGGQVMPDLTGCDGVHSYTRRHLERALFSTPEGPYRPAGEFTDDEPDWGDDHYLEQTRTWENNEGWQWRGGKGPGRGRTWGGCLEVITLLASADRWMPRDWPYRSLVLCLETSEEIPEVGRVRRMMLGLGERGLLSRAAAVLVGRPMARSHAVERGRAARRAYRERQYEEIATLVGEYNPRAPVVCGLDFGHTMPTMVPPMGVRLVVDPERERIVATEHVETSKNDTST
jgi:muramoyltetrapeptide carboxypeptidase LdcA involved in peptidoglycan recycling